MLSEQIKTYLSEVVGSATAIIEVSRAPEIGSTST
jgi:hypothetical protein